MAARTLPVITIFVASSLLSPQEFGSLAVLITCITLATLIADAGTDNAAGWRASHARTKDESDRILAALVYTRCTVALVATVSLTLPQASFLPGSTAAAVAIASVAALGNVLAAYNAARRIRMRVEGDGEPRALLREKLVLSATFAVWLLVVPPSATSLIWGFLIANVAGPLVAARRPYRVHLATTKSDVLELLKQAAPFITTTLCAALTWRVSTLILAHTGQVEEAGYLTLAYYPVQALSTIPNLAAPLLLIRSKQSELSFRQSAYVAVATGTGLALFGLAACWTVSQSWSPFSLPGSTVETLAILLLAMPMLWANPILVAQLRMQAGPWRPTIAPIIASTIAFAAALNVVPSGGAPAAASVIAGAETLVSILLLLLFWSGLRESSAQRPPVHDHSPATATGRRTLR